MARYTESHHIILYGDFNSRTGRAPDYDDNINVLNERCNEDGVINKYGRSLLNFCINTEFKIANGRPIIHPVHTKADQNVPDNYSKVTVMP